MKRQAPSLTDLKQQALAQLSTIFTPAQATQVEQGITNYTNQYVINRNAEQFYDSVYSEKLANIVYDMSQVNESTSKIRQTDDLANIAFLEPHETDYDNWKSIIERHQKDKDTLENLPGIERPDHPCRKCKWIVYEYHELQLRGLDEATTVFWKCKKCGTCDVRNG